jgi:hypothetical protein
VFRKTSRWVLSLKHNRKLALLKGLFYFAYCPFIPCFLVIKHVIARVTSKKELRRLRKERRIRLLAKQLEEEHDSDQDEQKSDQDGQKSDVETSQKEISQEQELLKELDYGLSDEYSRSEIETSDEVSIFTLEYQLILITTNSTIFVEKPCDIDELIDYGYPVFLNLYKVDSSAYPEIQVELTCIHHA